MKHLSAAQKQRGFRIHAIVFVPSMLLLFIINLLTGEPRWVLWVLLGWGGGPLVYWVTLRFHTARNVGTT
jgi:2TM domain